MGRQNAWAWNDPFGPDSQKGQHLLVFFAFRRRKANGQLTNAPTPPQTHANQVVRIEHVARATHRMSVAGGVS